MCNIYSQKCEKCGRFFPIHLADFAYRSKDILVFCGRHIPKDNVAIERITDSGNLDWPLRKGTRAGFRYKVTLPTGYNFSDFCLNIMSQSEMTILGNPVIQASADGESG